MQCSSATLSFQEVDFLYLDTLTERFSRYYDIMNGHDTARTEDNLITLWFWQLREAGLEEEPIVLAAHLSRAICICDNLMMVEVFS